MTHPSPVAPDWFRPKGAGAESFPAIWFDWLLHWTPPRETSTTRSRMLWYPGSPGISASWLLLPPTPVYGAHLLQGWPSKRRASAEGLRDLTDLVWVPQPEPSAELVGVWPNRVQIDADTGVVVAQPATSHVARHRREDAEGLPCFAQPVTRPALDGGAFHVFVLDGHYRKHTAAARRLKVAVDGARRQQVLREMLALGPTSAAAALLLRDEPHPAWVVLSCRYPDAVRAMAPDVSDRIRLRLLRELVTVVVGSALPGLQQHDDTSTEPERAALAGAVRHEILRALSLESGAVTPATIAAALVPDSTRGRRLVPVLARGWKTDPVIAADIKNWTTISLDSPLDRVLVPLSRLLGLPTNEHAHLVTVRHWVLKHVADGIDTQLISTLAQAEDDPADDRSLMHWVVLLGLSFLTSRLPTTSAVSTR